MAARAPWLIKCWSTAAIVPEAHNSFTFVTLHHDYLTCNVNTKNMYNITTCTMRHYTAK